MKGLQSFKLEHSRLEQPAWVQSKSAARHQLRLVRARIGLRWQIRSLSEFKWWAGQVSKLAGFLEWTPSFWSALIALGGAYVAWFRVP